MTVADLIAKLQALDTSTPKQVVVLGNDGAYYTPTVEAVRVAIDGEAPFEEDNDRPFVLAIRAADRS